MRQKRLRKNVDNPMSQPTTVCTVDAIMLEHGTTKGKGGLQIGAVSNAQQSLGMSDDKRYKDGREPSTITDCGLMSFDSNNNTYILELCLNILICRLVIRL